MMAVSSGYRILNSCPFHPRLHVSRLEICSCHFLLSLFTIFSCHNTSRGQWSDLHSLNLLLGREKKWRSRKIRPPSTISKNYVAPIFFLFLAQGHWVLSFCLSSFCLPPLRKWWDALTGFLHTWALWTVGWKVEFSSQVRMIATHRAWAARICVFFGLWVVSVEDQGHLCMHVISLPSTFKRDVKFNKILYMSYNWIHLLAVCVCSFGLKNK